ncbi:MAG: hypothetical protein OXD37_01800 [Acidimicrobiaceae bacterium]|nr:hypothetical protein [Acidimicrobiaceae bacterium]
MRGSVLLVAASLGFAVILSTLFWMARKVTWRRSVSPLRRLQSLSETRERSGPSSGVSIVDSMASDLNGSAQNLSNGAADRFGGTPESPHVERPRQPDSTMEASADAPVATER